MMTVTTTRTDRSAVAVALSGSAVIAVSFGFARYGFGLFVPSLRADFGLSDAAVGAIGSVGYVGYLAGLLASGALTTRVGPRTPVLLGAGAAAVGLALVALAPSRSVLLVGLLVAASASGWVFAPFSDAVVLLVAAPDRPRVLSTISTGTTFGLIAAGPLALLAGGSGGSWRWAWGGFAAVGTLALVAAARVLPPGAVLPQPPVSAAAAGAGRAGGRRLRPRRAALPLLAQAAGYGLIAGVYYTFAVDLVRGQGLGPAWSSLLWTLVGIGGTSGVGTGAMVRAMGLRRALGGCLALLALSVGALGAFPGTAAVVGPAALVFGFAYMPIAALLVLWNQDISPEAPARGFTAVLGALAAGSIAGPLVVGLVTDRLGLRVVFLLLAVVALAGLRLRPPAVSPWSARPGSEPRRPASGRSPWPRPRAASARSSAGPR